MNFIEENPILIGAIIVIVLAYLYFSNRLKSNDPIVNHATSTLTSLGILGTFLGITIALFNFDTLDITNSIPKLLGGLKIAFISSILGLSLAILFRYEKSKSDENGENAKDEYTAGDFFKQVSELTKEIANGNKDIKEALVGDGDASLSTQIGKLRNDFRDFAEKVAEDGSQKLIEALEQVIKDFNQKISEQFGENFKQLNEAVGALLVWQKEHKAQVEKLTELFEETQKGIEVANQSIQSIEASTSKIPNQMKEVETVFEKTDLRMEELHSALGTLANLREKAEESLPIVEEHLNAIGDGIKTSVEKQLNTMNDSFNAMEKGNENIQSNLADLITSVSDSANLLVDSAKGSQEELKGVMVNIGTDLTKSAQSLQEMQQNSANDIEAKMRQSIETATENINSLVQEVSNKMAEQVNQNVETLGQNLTAVSQALNESYERHAQEVNKALNKTKG